MNKKRLFSTILCVSLVLILGIGATLAWLTDTAGAVVNTFTVGDVNIEITEIGPEGQTPNDTGGFDYDMLPGDVEVKEPFITVQANSVDSFVFMSLQGADALAAFGFELVGIDSGDWIRVAGTGSGPYDGLYKFVGTVPPSTVAGIVPNAASATALTPLFTHIALSADADQEALATATLSDIVINGFAIQSANTDEVVDGQMIAVTQAVEWFNQLP